MPEPTATRRLVKSPPELWAELSSEDSLGRHLAEFGEIRITRVEPETTVAWEGDRASGTVELTPTGWGTKVVLTAVPATPSPDRPPATASGRDRGRQPQASEKPPAPPSPVTPPAGAGAGAGSVPPRAEAPSALPPAGAGLTPPPAGAGLTPPWSEAPSAPPRAEAPAPAQAKRGFFARLFGKRPPEQQASPPPASSIPGPPAPGPDPAPPAPSPDPGPVPPPAPDPAPPAPSPDPGPVPPPAPDPVPPSPAPEPPAPAQIEVLDPERTVAILTEVLDDLGAAHHRPFSRD